MRGTEPRGSGNGTLELFNHAYDHGGWRENYKTPGWQLADMQKSSGGLKRAYPAASIQTFVAPENKANAGTISPGR